MASLSFTPDELAELTTHPVLILDSYGAETRGEPTLYDFGVKLQYLSWPVTLSIFQIGVGEGSGSITHRMDCGLCGGANKPDVRGSNGCVSCGHDARGLDGFSKTLGRHSVPERFLNSLASAFQRAAVASGGDILVATLLARAATDACGALILEAMKLSRENPPERAVELWSAEVARPGVNPPALFPQEDDFPWEVAEELLHG